MPVPLSQPATGKTFGDSEKAAEACKDLEGRLHELKALYDMYFLGQERKPPTKQHEDVKKGVAALRNQVHRQTAIKFRIGGLAQKLATYERLWERTLKEIEAGTYSRDVFKARLHRQAKEGKKDQKDDVPEPEFHIDEDFSLDDDEEEGTDPDIMASLANAAAKAAAPQKAPPAAPPPAAKPPGSTSATAALKPAGSTGATAALKPAGSTGATAALKPAGSTGATAALKPGAAPAAAAKGPVSPVAAQGGLTDQKIKAIYDAYVTAKKRCGEDTTSLSFTSVADSLKKQVPELMKQHNAKSVEFKVVIKDGKAVLRALPKE